MADASGMGAPSGGLKAAMDDLARAIDAAGNPHDKEYFLEHALRYERTLKRMAELAPPGGRILDVGSHMLHQTAPLARLGFQVEGMDVPLFAEDPLVAARAAAFGVLNHAVESYEAGEFIPGGEDRFDAVVFTEILEHITFNPVKFWKRVYEVLKPGGFVYITTPNSITFGKFLRTAGRLATLKGIGLPPPRIFDTWTYGHHWKEYSGPEIREYFAMLSPDFAVDLDYYNLERSFRSPLRRAAHQTASLARNMREQIEAVVKLKGRTSWSLSPPGAI